MMTLVEQRIRSEYYDNIIHEAYEKYALDKETRSQYRDIVRQTEKVFKCDLEDSLELTGHPKADRLFELAWEYGHSSGFHEVYWYYKELSDLLK